MRRAENHASGRSDPQYAITTWLRIYWTKSPAQWFPRQFEKYHSMIRPVKSLLISLFFLVFLFSWLITPAAEGIAALKTRKLPNIVVILADDLGGHDLACYGADLHETPNLDRFAQGALKFNCAYASAPICSPTRASLLTGKHPARLHMTIWYEGAKASQSSKPDPNRKLVPPAAVSDLPLSEVTIAERLRDAGYLTALVGKWHLGDAAHYPETQGFDVNIGGTFWGAPATHFFPYRGAFGQDAEYRYVPHLELGKPGEYLTDRLTDEAIHVVESAGERPFFLYLAFHAVHTPIEGKPDHVEHFRQKMRPEYHHQNPDFAAMVYSMDENVGRLLKRLDDLHLADDTIVVFTSDNGGFVNEFEGRQVTTNYPLRSGKGSLYEGGIRVPLIVRWPGLTKANTQCGEPVVTADFVPTFAAGLGLNVNEPLDGVDIAPLLADPSAKLARDSLYFHYPHYYQTTTPVSAMRQREWKLLHYFEDDRCELYNLAEDAGEEHDLSAAQPQRTESMLKQLQKWRTEIGAQIPARRG